MSLPPNVSCRHVRSCSETGAAAGERAMKKGDFTSFFFAIFFMIWYTIIVSRNRCVFLLRFVGGICWERSHEKREIPENARGIRRFRSGRRY